MTNLDGVSDNSAEVTQELRKDAVFIKNYL